MHEYAFDIYLAATVRVPAASEDEARQALYAALDGAGATLGAWINGSPILAEASPVNDGLGQPPHLYEIDGEATA